MTMKESKQTYRVAIADDDELAIRALSDITSEIPGFSVDLVACNGKELYDKLNAAEVLPDIVMLDISMPVWDGYQTIHALKKKWPDIKVLVITMHKHEFGIIKMLKNDANGYLLKNSKPQEIKKALQSIAEKG